MRAFVAIEASLQVSRALAGLVERLPRVRDVRVGDVRAPHLTLKFLGDVDPSRLPALGEVLAAASAELSPFPIALGGLGAFPDAERPRVLFAHVDDPARGCERWLARAEPLFSALGFPVEARAFVPHFTLARSRSRAGAHLLREAMELLAEHARHTGATAPRTMIVERVVLFETVPAGASRGPHHAPRIVSPLGGPPTD